MTFCSNCETEDDSENNERELPTPSYSAADIANVQTFVTSGDKFGLLEPVTMSWVLYSEKNWSVW